jgi:hypothetical protein
MTGASGRSASDLARSLPVDLDAPVPQLEAAVAVRIGEGRELPAAARTRVSPRPDSIGAVTRKDLIGRLVTRNPVETPRDAQP